MKYTKKRYNLFRSSVVLSGEYTLVVHFSL